MLNVSPHDLGTVVGPTTDFVKSEILRVGAPLAELKMAIALVGGQATFDHRTYDSLSPRMRRLIDLVGVAGVPLASSIYETAATDSQRQS